MYASYRDRRVNGRYLSLSRSFALLNFVMVLRVINEVGGAVGLSSHGQKLIKHFKAAVVLRSQQMSSGTDNDVGASSAGVGDGTYGGVPMPDGVASTPRTTPPTKEVFEAFVGVLAAYGILPLDKLDSAKCAAASHAIFLSTEAASTAASGECGGGSRGGGAGVAIGAPTAKRVRRHLPDSASFGGAAGSGCDLPGSDRASGGSGQGAAAAGGSAASAGTKAAASGGAVQPAAGFNVSAIQELFGPGTSHGGVNNVSAPAPPQAPASGPSPEAAAARAAGSGEAVDAPAAPRAQASESEAMAATEAADAATAAKEAARATAVAAATKTTMARTASTTAAAAAAAAAAATSARVAATAAVATSARVAAAAAATSTAGGAAAEAIGGAATPGGAAAEAEATGGATTTGGAAAEATVSGCGGSGEGGGGGLDEKDPVRVEFMQHLKQFHLEIIGTELKVPRRVKVEINLHDLYNVVVGKGGYEAVSSGKLWKEVRVAVFGREEPYPSAGTHDMRTKYLTCLLTYEEHVRAKA